METLILLKKVSKLMHMSQKISFASISIKTKWLFWKFSMHILIEPELHTLLHLRCLTGFWIRLCPPLITLFSRTVEGRENVSTERCWAQMSWSSKSLNIRGKELSPKFTWTSREINLIRSCFNRKLHITLATFKENREN